MVFVLQPQEIRNVVEMLLMGPNGLLLPGVPELDVVGFIGLCFKLVDIISCLP